MSTARKIIAFIGLPLLIIFAVIIVWAFQRTNVSPAAEEVESIPTPEVEEETVATKVQWEQGVGGWIPDGTPPECAEPFKIITPTKNLSDVTTILYPGQDRGGDYKPHGGFRFDNSANEDIGVIIPIDSNLVNASRYLSGGEVQYLLTFIAPCGMSYRFDHAADLIPKIQKVMDTLPEATEGDSRTTNISPQIEFKQGEVVASAVGIKKDKNVFFDFGVYDLRENGKFKTTAASFVKNHKGDENALNGVCWFDFLPAADSKLVKNLPASGASGSTSDTCP